MLDLSPAEDRILLESSSNDFFGFNLTSLNEKGLLGGLQDVLDGMYTFALKPHLTNVVYKGIVTNFADAFIRLTGWIVLGSLVILKGLVFQYFYGDTGRSYEDTILPTVFDFAQSIANSFLPQEVSGN